MKLRQNNEEEDNFAKLSISFGKSLTHENNPTCSTTPNSRLTETKESKATSSPKKKILSGYLGQKQSRFTKTRNLKRTFKRKEFLSPVKES